MMKRIATVCLSVLTGILCLTGCSRNAPEKKDGLSVVATIYPEYDWVLNIMGEKAEDANVKLLLDNGSDMHSFQPSIADIALIQNSDLFIYVGGESDDWVEGVLEGKQNEDMIVINLLEVLGDRVKTEEIIEGMEQEEEHDADGEGQHHHEAQEESDEHVWLSLKNAVVCCDAIAEGLVTADGANADVYRTNLAAYRERLNALDEEYKKAVDAASGDTLLFGDRFPFRYLADDYQLNYYAAFAGCSAETEAGFETVIFLAGKADEFHLNTILTLENSSSKIAETIQSNTKTKNQKILTLDSMQSINLKDAKNGRDYLTIMKDNLEVMKEALE